jgi:microcystin degradation protein MlrC
MARIAVGGFQHETNTFAPTKATFAHFEMADGWPALTTGPALFEAVSGINLPAAGFADAARQAGHELVPLLWCSATPLAHVERDAYERIAGMMLDELRGAGSLDALYLDLHGAMVAEHLEDGEGELLRRVRAIVGPDLPIVVSLDLHANITRAMVEQATLLHAFRTYPHIDMADTGARTADLLGRVLREGAPAKALRKPPFLIPLVWQCTTIEPAASIYREVAALERGDVMSVTFTPGFSPADIAECGPGVVAYARTQEAAEKAAAHIERLVLESERDFAGQVYDPDAAVRHALAECRKGRRPVVLADTQDNPGAGTDSDSMGLFAALVENGAAGAVEGLICDPDAAAIAHQAGEGSEIAIELGERSGLPGHQPFRGTFKVEKIGDGRFTATGPFYSGSRMQLGRMALLSINGVKAVVSSRKQQAADQSMFRHLGIEPREQPILALKSSVHFRADFQPIAAEILIVAAPGANPVDHLALPYRHLRKGVRLMPMGPEFGGV